MTRFPLRYINESLPDFPMLGLRRQTAPWSCRSFRESLTFALNGLRYAFATQRNLRIQSVLGACAVSAALALKLPFHETALVCTLAALVLFAELMNTAIEHMLDVHVGTAFDLSVKRIKDMTGAAVLVVSIGAGVLGAAIFLPHVRSCASRLARIPVVSPQVIAATLLSLCVLWGCRQHRQLSGCASVRLTTGVLLAGAALLVLVGLVFPH